MKKLFALLMIIGGWQLSMAQVDIPWQEITYNVNYHWGFIDVNIARGTVTVSTDGNTFNGTLDGSSIPWEGKIICVSDTLRANMAMDNGSWKESVKYQSGWYRHTPVGVYHTAGYTPDNPAYFKNISGAGNYAASGDSMEAITVTSDMLGMYYFAHALDFESMEPGQSITIPIEGRYAYQVVITYQGKDIYFADGNSYPCYNCSFEYSYGDKMSGFPVDCKISTSSRIPLFLSASLPVGRVEMLYQH